MDLSVVIGVAIPLLIYGAIGARIEFGTCNLKHIILYIAGFRRIPDKEQ